MNLNLGSEASRSQQIFVSSLCLQFQTVDKICFVDWQIIRSVANHLIAGDWPNSQFVRFYQQKERRHRATESFSRILWAIVGQHSQIRQQTEPIIFIWCIPARAATPRKYCIHIHNNGDSNVIGAWWMPPMSPPWTKYATSQHQAMAKIRSISFRDSAKRIQQRVSLQWTNQRLCRRLVSIWTLS